MQARLLNSESNATAIAALEAQTQSLINEFYIRQKKYSEDCAMTMHIFEQYEADLNRVLKNNINGIEGGEARLTKLGFSFRSLHQAYSEAHDFEFIPVNYHHSVTAHSVYSFLNEIKENVINNRDKLTKALLAMGRIASVSALLSQINEQWSPNPNDKLWLPNTLATHTTASPKSVLMASSAAPIKFLTNLSMMVNSIVKNLDELIKIDHHNYDRLERSIYTAKSISKKVLGALAVFNSIDQIKMKNTSTNRRLLVMKKLIDKISKINPSPVEGGYFKVGTHEEFSAALQATLRHDSIQQPKHETMIDELLLIAAAEANDELAAIDTLADSYVVQPSAAISLFQPQGILHEVCSYKVKLEQKLKSIELNLLQLNNLTDKQNELIAKIVKSEQEHYRLLEMVAPNVAVPATLVKMSQKLPPLVDQGATYTVNTLIAWIRRLIKLLNDESFSIRGEQTSPWLTTNIEWLRENVNITTLRIPMAIDHLLQHRQMILQDNTDLLDRYIYLVQENERLEEHALPLTYSSTLPSI